MRKIKRLLKPLYHEFMALQCVFERTIFAPIHNIHVPLNKNVKIGKNVKFYNSSRIIYYDGLVSIGPNTEVCSFSKFIIGGGGAPLAEIACWESMGYIIYLTT